MQIDVLPAVAADIDEVERLYIELNCHLSENGNRPGWIKDVYPSREVAEDALEAKSLFVARVNGAVAGAVIIDQSPAKAYFGAPWRVECSWDEVLIMHTLAVHPEQMKRGVASAMLRFAQTLAKQRGMRAIRLDSYRTNTPAFALYEKHGYEYIATVDLDMHHYGLDFFRLYELPIGEK